MSADVPWAAILGVGGTLGGVIVTQVANLMITRAARRKDGNDRINDAVGDLIACGQAWVYAVNGLEESMFNTVIGQKPDEEVQAAITTGRAAVYAAQLAYGRAQARVRLTCPQEINSADADYREALQAFEDSMTETVGVVLHKGDVSGIPRTVPEGVVAPLDRLVQVTRKETGRVLTERRIVKLDAMSLISAGIAVAIWVLVIWTAIAALVAHI